MFLNLINVISNEIREGFRRIKLRRYGNGDVQTSYHVSPPGVDSAPIKGMVAVYSKTNKRGKPVVLGYVNKSLLAQDGETRIFSIGSDGELSTFIWLRGDGTMDVGGSADNLVRFAPAKAGFDQLVDDVNDLKNKWNTFASAYVAGGPAVQGLPPTAQTSPASTANIDDAKIDEIKTL